MHVLGGKGNKVKTTITAIITTVFSVVSHSVKKIVALTINIVLTCKYRFGYH